MKVTIWTFFLSMLSMANLNAFERTVILKPYKQQILIGEDITVELLITCKSGDEIILPDLSDTITKNIEITDLELLDTLLFENSDSIQIKQFWHITSFDSGVWAFPPVPFYINGDTFETKPFIIDVGTVEIDTSQSIRDITEPVEIPYTFGELFRKYGIPILISSAALLFLLYVLDRRKKKIKNKPVNKPKVDINIPSHIWAMSELQKLKEQQLWEQGQVKEFHVRLSEIARTYVELSLNVPAMESTTEEIRQLLGNTEIERESVEIIVSSLRLSDLVKYAKYRPHPSENERAFQEIIQFVEQTSPEEPKNNPESV